MQHFFRENAVGLAPTRETVREVRARWGGGHAPAIAPAPLPTDAAKRINAPMREQHEPRPHSGDGGVPHDALPMLVASSSVALLLSLGVCYMLRCHLRCRSQIRRCMRGRRHQALGTDLLRRF